MDLTEQITTYATAAVVLAQGVAYLWRKGADTEEKRAGKEAKTEDWLRKTIDAQLKARDKERSDCTEKIRLVERRLDEERAECDDKIEGFRSQVETLVDARAGDIQARHELARQLRAVTSRMDSIHPPASDMLKGGG